MEIGELAKLAKRVAKKVRIRIPRSSNRTITEEGGASDWLHNPDKIASHVRLLHNLVRTVSTRSDTMPNNVSTQKIGGPLDKIVRKRKTKFLCFPGKTKYDGVTVSDLKRIILQFIQSEGIDMSYRTREAELAYADEFGNKLATYLNNRGYRKIVDNNGHISRVDWQGSRVIDNLNSDLIEHLRLSKFGISDNNFANTNVALQLPLKYIIGNARNALKFHIGNCEECASAAFLMLLLGKDAQGEAIDTGGQAYPVELVYIKSPEGAAHFFVVVNRQDFDTETINGNKDDWPADDATIICDPWISDVGLGGRVTSANETMGELRNWIEESSICVRATGYVGQGVASMKQKDEPLFYL